MIEDGRRILKSVLSVCASDKNVYVSRHFRSIVVSLQEAKASSTLPWCISRRAREGCRGKEEPRLALRNTKGRKKKGVGDGNFPSILELSSRK